VLILAGCTHQPCSSRWAHRTPTLLSTLRERLFPDRWSLFLLGFGFASAIYKVVLVLGISALIATKFFVLGLFVG